MLGRPSRCLHHALRIVVPGHTEVSPEVMNAHSGIRVLKDLLNIGVLKPSSMVGVNSLQAPGY